MLRLLLSLVFALFFICSNAQLANLRLWNINNKRVKLTTYSEKEALVFIFLSPECPLSKNYTRQINELEDEFSSSQVKIFSVFSGKDYKIDELYHFKEEFRIKSTILLDKKYELATLLKAAVTPEAFLYRNSDETVVYSGAIDNWVIQLGKQRKEISEYYLMDALIATIEGRNPKINRTKAIGCFLEIK